MFLIETILTSCTAVNADYFANIQSDGSETEPFYVKFLDVGQADSAVVYCEGHVMVIDGGNTDDGVFVSDEINQTGIDSVDILVNTHAHEDHCGGLTDVVNSFDVQTAVISPETNSTVSYESFLLALEEHNVVTETAQAGEHYELGSADIEILGPISSAGDLNNSSVVLKITYHDVSFLFMGDAEQQEESELMENGADLRSEVLKVGHHGSDTSSTESFLQQVGGQYAVISVGQNNSYGHPSSGVLHALKDNGYEIYRTDREGTVTVTIDDSGKIEFLQ